MLALIFTFLLLFIALYGYFISVKKSKLESEIRKNNLDYQCFECKEIISVNDLKCPHCSFETLYGRRRKKFWVIIPIIITWIFMVSKFSRLGLF